MNEKNTEVNVAAIESATEERFEDVSQHDVYDYFKEHPSVFFAATSAFIATISIILNFTVFLRTNSYLIYFQVDNVVYKSSTPLVYSVAITLLFSTVLMLFQGFLSKTFENYLPYKRKFLLHKYSFKEIKKDIKRGNKLRKSIKKNMLCSHETASKNDTTVQVHKDLEWLNQDAKRIHHEYRSLIKTARKCKIVYHMLIGLSCFIAWLALVVVLTLVLSISLFEWDSITLAAMVFSAVIVVIIAVIYWFFLCILRLNKKKIQADMKIELKDRLSLYDDLPDIPISSLLGGRIKDVFTDKNVKNFISTVAICLTVLIFVSTRSGSQSASTQKDFFVVYIDEQAYVLIYNNGENAVFEKVDIYDHTLVIDTTYQKIMPLNNIDMTKQRFDNVEVLRIEDKSCNDLSECTDRCEQENSPGGNQ